MPQNFIMVFPVPDSDEVEKLESKMQEEVVRVAEKIHSRKIAGIKKDGLLLWIINHTLFSLVRLVYNATDYFGMQKKFYADDQCTGCGTCEKVCLSGTVVMEDSHPVWKQDTECLHCLACLNYCPNHAVQVRKSKTLIRGRYHHPEVSAEEIIIQKK